MIEALKAEMNEDLKTCSKTQTNNGRKQRNLLKPKNRYGISKDNINQGKSRNKLIRNLSRKGESWLLTNPATIQLQKQSYALAIPNIHPSVIC